MFKKITFIALPILLAAFSVFSANFSIKNLKNLPTYELYEFKATGTTLEESTVKIEYRLVNRDTDSASWVVKGSMPINGLFIEEEYLIRLKNLEVISSKRKQNFKKGSSESVSSYEVDTRTTDSTDFIISTFQGLMYILRAFPMESHTKELSVYMAQQTTEKISIKVRNKGEKPIATPKYGTEQATEIMVSLAVPLVGGFLPNVSYFFRNDGSRSMLAMKGAFSMTGKKMDVLLVKHVIEK